MQKALLSALVASCFTFLATGHVQASKPRNDDGSAVVKKRKVSKATYYEDKRYLHGSNETARQRDQRLTRECRGAPNAGACSGYGR